MKIYQTLLTVLALTLSTLSWADPVWIDVRSVEEYKTDHIDGDLNIPHSEIKVEELAAKYGKDAEIMLYCRSGNRAGQAKAALEAAGFSKVTNAGSIGDARKLRSLPLPAATPAQ
jgi:phage shock protein E